jgi:protein-disulfide isomerase
VIQLSYKKGGFMEGKGFYIGLAVFVVVAVSGFAFLNKTDEKKVDVADLKKTTVVAENDHIKGDKASKVVLVEYADFQCPSCAAMHPLLEQATTELSGNFVFVFRSFPLTSIHPNSLAAHRAAEAANLQGKFFEMHDLLYANQTKWSSANNPEKEFEKFAKQIGLDVEKYKKDVISQKVLDRINIDMESGEAEKVESTPTLYLNGKKLDSEQFRTYDKLKSTLEKAIQEAK